MLVHFLEINEAVLGKPVATEPVSGAVRWLLLARCDGDQSSANCGLMQNIVNLGRANKEDGKSALSALDKLINVAATGQPLEGF